MISKDVFFVKVTEILFSCKTAYIKSKFSAEIYEML